MMVYDKQCQKRKPGVCVVAKDVVMAVADAVAMETRTPASRTRRLHYRSADDDVSKLRARINSTSYTLVRINDRSVVMGGSDTIHMLPIFWFGQEQEGILP